MLFAESVYKAFGPLEVLRGASLTVGKGERAALVGPNGAGKTTLFKIIAGDESPDSGVAGLTSGEALGHLRQEAGLDPGRGVLEELWTAFPEARAAELRLHEIADLLERGDGETDALIDEQAELFERFDSLDGYRIESRIGRVLVGLGFEAGDSGRRCSEFSGGWQMRIALAKVLVRRPENMLLDEPTNHLDAASKAFLAADLCEYKGALIVITHDGEFLDQVANRILELREGQIDSYAGDYSEYQRTKAARLQQQDREAARQEREIARQERFIERFRAKNSKATLVKSREKMVARIERVERPRKESEVHIGLQAHGRTENDVLVMEHIGHAYADGRGGENVVLVDVNLHLERGQKAVLVGPNGGGKTTLLKIAAGFIEQQEGTASWAGLARIGYYDQHQDEALDPALTALEEAQQAAPAESETRLRTVLGNFLFRGDDVHKRVRMLSGGERSRLALVKLVLQPTNVLILDEPTNHLDRTTRRKLIEVLAKYEGTILCAAHDPGILDRVATRVFEVSGGQCRELIQHRRD
jgi:ATP-binding cassette subfamily F protein 3